jgi:uncharacterized protein with GYD domain
VPLYIYEAAYTSESLRTLINDPEDRLATVAKQIESSGVKMVAGGFSFGEYDVVAIFDAPDDVTMAAVSVAISAVGAIRAAKTNQLLTGPQFVETLKKAASIGYKAPD